MQLDLAQSGIAATFQIRDHALDAVDLVDIRAERLGHDRIDGESGRGEHTLDLLHGMRLPCNPAVHKIACALPWCQRVQHGFQAFMR